MPLSRPHFVDPSKDSVHLIIAYKNFAASQSISHIGLGVAAMNNAAVLNAAGYWTEVWPILSADDLAAKLTAANQQALASNRVPVSNVVISAPWIPAAALAALSRAWHDIDFTVVSHSNVGFLMADPTGIAILRQTADLGAGSTNVHVGANCSKLQEWWRFSYQQRMRLLPNMYSLSAPTVTQRWRQGNGIRIGSFGAIRPLKNLVTAGAAALEIAARLQAQLEFCVSAGRTEGGAGTVIGALSAMYDGLPYAKLVQIGWQNWPAFRRVVRSMDLMLQPSYTESFNMVTADGAAEGVPSVTSDAITWVPPRWVASIDDANQIADVGIALLYDPQAAESGLAALKENNAMGMRAWTSMLVGEA